MKHNYLMISGHNEKHLNKISSVDGIVMLNLEDGVPQDKKQFALENIIKFLKNNNLNKKIIVRINDLKTTGLEEIKKLNNFNISFRIPKIETIKELNKIFEITDKDIYLSIETKQAFFDLKSFNHNQIKGFYLGILDLFDDLKLSHELIKIDNDFIKKILIDFSLDCLYLDKIGVGFVYQQYKDLKGFKNWCELQKDFGLKGVGCITPNQLKIANEVFEDKNLEYAKMIVKRFESEGPFTIDGLYVDEPIYKNYKLKIKS